MASHSDSEDDRPRQSDEDVLRDEADAEALLHPQKRSWLGQSDPNQPRPVAQHTQHDQQRLRRRERREQRRQERRGGGGEDERGLLFDGEEKGDDDVDSISSTDSAFAAPAPQKRGRKRLRIAVSVAALLGLLAALVYGALAASRSDAAAKQEKKPAGPAGAQDAQLRSNGTHTFGRTTILVSLDGFRADFLARNITPVLNAFIREGVSPKYMLPSFPSLTFPNHWTLATGLHPESHGVVGNSFWDPALQEEFWYTDPARSMDPKWWTSTGAEPIWASAETQGVRAAVHMWPGSEAGIEPAPTFLDKYNGKETLPNKVASVLALLDLPGEADEGAEELGGKTRPQLISFYVPNVDTAGHRYGPNSTEIRGAISDVDMMLGSLLDELAERNLTDIVNVVVVSDHGMATIKPELLFQFEDLVDPARVAHIDGWPLYGLRPAPGVDVFDLFTTLKSTTGMNPFLSVHLRSDMPPEWHFNASDRIAPLWIVPRPGAAIVQLKDFDVAAGGEYGLKGLHGYDHRHPLMRAIFVARGPAFPHPAHSELAVFQNIEVYNMVCDSVGIAPRPNNGTLRLPLKPLGVHGQLPHEVETPSDPPAGEEEETEEEMEEELGLWQSMLSKLKDTWQKISDFFGSGGGGEVVEVVETDQYGNPTVEVIEEPMLVVGEDGELEIVEEPVAVIELEPQAGP